MNDPEIRRRDRADPLVRVGHPVEEQRQHLARRQRRAEAQLADRSQRLPAHGGVRRSREPSARGAKASGPMKLMADGGIGGEVGLRQTRSRPRGAPGPRLVRGCRTRAAPHAGARAAPNDPGGTACIWGSAWVPRVVTLPVPLLDVARVLAVEVRKPRRIDGRHRPCLRCGATRLPPAAWSTTRRRSPATPAEPGSRRTSPRCNSYRRRSPRPRGLGLSLRVKFESVSTARSAIQLIVAERDHEVVGEDREDQHLAVARADETREPRTFEIEPVLRERVPFGPRAAHAGRRSCRPCPRSAASPRTRRDGAGPDTSARAPWSALSRSRSCNETGPSRPRRRRHRPESSRRSAGRGRRCFRLRRCRARRGRRRPSSAASLRRGSGSPSSATRRCLSAAVTVVEVNTRTGAMPSLPS